MNALNGKTEVNQAGALKAQPVSQWKEKVALAPKVKTHDIG